MPTLPPTLRIRLKMPLAFKAVCDTVRCKLMMDNPSKRVEHGGEHSRGMSASQNRPFWCQSAP